MSARGDRDPARRTHRQRGARGSSLLLLAAACITLWCWAGVAGAARHERAALSPNDHPPLFMAPPGLQGTLLAGDPSAGAQLGRAVAVSGDVAVVGAPGQDVGPQQKAGAVYVFARSPAGRWTAQARLTALDGVALDDFGCAVDVSGDTVVGATGFTVIPAPAITGLKPASGKRRATVTIAGAGFGATRSGAVVKFGGKTCGAYLSWSDAQIKCKVPRKAKYGQVRVTVTTAGGVSNARSFRVKR